MTELLQRHESVQVIDEPLSMHTTLFPELDLLRWEASEFDADCLHAQLEAAHGAAAFTRDLLGYLRRTPQHMVRGFKETLLFEKLSWLQRALPTIRVIHLVRDPRAVLSSVLRHPMRKIWNYERTVIRYAQIYRDVPFDVGCEDSLDLAISSWQIRHYEAKRRLEDWPHITVRLEDLVVSPSPELTRIMHFLGEDVSYEQRKFAVVSQRESRGGPYSSFRRREQILHEWKSELSTAWVTRIETRLRHEMDQLGYC